MERTREDRLQEAIEAYLRTAQVLDPLRLRVWETMKITFPQLRILFRIRARPGIDLRRLAEELSITASAASQQVDKLVDHGLVARKEDAADRRRIHLELTPQGQQTAGEISRASRSYLRSILATLSDEELDILQQVLGRVLAAAIEVPIPTLI